MTINKKIVLVGANSIHTLRYLNAIAQSVTEIVFITNNDYQLELAAKIKVHIVNFKLNNLQAAKQIGKLLNQHQPDIVHIHQANSYAYHTLKAIKKYYTKGKTILTTWGSDVLVLPKQNAIFRHLVKFNLTQADIITAGSFVMSAQIRQLVPSVKELHTINFGIQHFPTTISLASKEKIILSNRLHKKLYNIDKIILGFARLIKTHNKYADYRLIIAGSGEETKNLKELAKQLQIPEWQIRFIGMVSYVELIKWYKKATLFISIPDSDSTSMSLLEAIAYGALPIVSNLPANLECIIDEINGIVCENQVLLNNDLYKALELINDQNKYQRLVQFNHELVKQKAVFDNNIQKFLNLYTAHN